MAIYNYHIKFSLIEGSMIKNNLRLTFKKRQRNPFFQNFKTQVRESNSIDAIRLTPAKTYCNSQSPIKDRTVARKFTGLSTTVKTKYKQQAKDREQKTVKIKLNYVSPKFISLGQTPIKQGSIDRGREQISNFQHHSGSLIDILKQSPRQDRKNIMQEGRRQNKSKVKIQNSNKIAEEMMQATQFLLSHANQLKKYQVLQDQAESLNKVLNQLAGKLKKVCKEDQSPKNSFLRIPVHKERKPFLKKKLFQSSKLIQEQQEEESNISKQRGQKSKLKQQSVASFKIQNESSHENQHFYIYEEKSQKQQSDRDISVKSSSQVPSRHNCYQTSTQNQVATVKKDRTTVKLRKGSQQINKIQIHNKKPRKYSEQEKKLDPLPIYTSIEENQNDDARIYSTQSSVQNERKRSVLNEIIGMLNRKYSRKIKQ